MPSPRCAAEDVADRDDGLTSFMPCKGYDYRRCRHECRIRGIRFRIARRGLNNSQRLGRHRWVVERTHAWLNRLRRLSVRYERGADIFLAFNILGCALVCLKQIRRFC